MTHPHRFWVISRILIGGHRPPLEGGIGSTPHQCSSRGRQRATSARCADVRICRCLIVMIMTHRNDRYSTVKKGWCGDGSSPVRTIKHTTPPAIYLAQRGNPGGGCHSTGARVTGVRMQPISSHLSLSHQYDSYRIGWGQSTTPSVCPLGVGS